MKPLYSITFLVALTVAPSFATIYPTTFTDPTAAQNPGDVIGDPTKFDIYSLKLSNFNLVTNTLQINIDFNYGGGFSAGAFQGFTISGFSPTLNVGDIFFDSGASKYAIAMSAHNGLTQGSLYSITGSQTASSVLGNPGGSYRPTTAVWADSSGSALLGSGTVSAASLGGNRYDTTVTVNTNTAFRSMLNGAYSVTFESATCANDIVTGSVSASVPEPATMAMFGAGLLALGLLRQKA